MERDTRRLIATLALIAAFVGAAGWQEVAANESGTMISRTLAVDMTALTGELE